MVVNMIETVIDDVSVTTARARFTQLWFVSACGECVR